MNTSPSSRGVIAIGLTLIIMGVMAVAAATPLIEAWRLDGQIAQTRETLKQLQARTGDVARLREDHAALIASGQADDLLVEGETTGIAGANLQRIMNDIVVENGAKAMSLQILRPSEDKELVRIGMSLTIEANIDSLRAMLHAIETGTPLIFIENIAIEGSDSDFSQPDPNFIGPLDITMQVAAYTNKTETANDAE